MQWLIRALLFLPQLPLHCKTALCNLAGCSITNGPIFTSKPPTKELTLFKSTCKNSTPMSRATFGSMWGNFECRDSLRQTIEDRFEELLCSHYYIFVTQYQGMAHASWVWYGWHKDWLRSPHCSTWKVCHVIFNYFILQPLRSPVLVLWLYQSNFPTCTYFLIKKKQWNSLEGHRLLHWRLCRTLCSRGKNKQLQHCCLASWLLTLGCASPQGVLKSCTLWHIEHHSCFS